MKSRTVIYSVFTSTAVVMFSSLVGCSFTISKPNNMAQGTGQSNLTGNVEFRDPLSKQTIPVTVQDADTKEPIQNIDVNFLSNGSRYLIVVHDGTGQYLPDLYEATFDKKSSLLDFGATTAHAQSPIEGILFLLELQSKIKSIGHFNSLFLQNRPNVEFWNWEYHDECWTHEQLKQGIQLEMEGVQLIFPAADAFGDITDQLVEAIMLSSGEAIDLNNQIFSKLPDPVSLRLYHIPITIPGITIRVMGSCSASEEITPNRGGFATLIANQPAAVFSVETVISGEGNSSVTQIAPTSAEIGIVNLGFHGIPILSDEKYPYIHCGEASYASKLQVIDARNFYIQKMGDAGWNLFHEEDINSPPSAAWLLFEKGNQKAVVYLALLGNQPGVDPEYQIHISIDPNKWDIDECGESKVTDDIPQVGSYFNNFDFSYIWDGPISIPARTDNNYNYYQTQYIFNTLVSINDVETFYKKQMVLKGWTFIDEKYNSKNDWPKSLYSSYIMFYKKPNRIVNFTDNDGPHTAMLDGAEINIFEEAFGTFVSMDIYRLP